MLSTVKTQLAPEILNLLEGEKPALIREIVGKGEANRVFDVTLPRRSVIIKMHRSERSLGTYKKEAWCTNRATTLGIPSPKVLGYGGIAPSDKGEFRCFLLLEKLEGRHGADTSEADQMRIWRKLGEYAQKIHTIKTLGYGFELIDEKTGTFQTTTWKKEVSALRDEYLNNKNLTDGSVMSSRLFNRALEQLSILESWDVQPKLSHSNLVPKNAVFSPRGEVFLIDWGTAFSGPAVLQEVAELSTWDFPSQALQEFREGYGVTSQVFAELQEQARPLIVLRALDTIGWAANEVPNWREKSFVTHSLKKLESLLA